MSPSTIVVERQEYENVSGHIIGVVKIDRKGNERGFAVREGERVWLSEDERRLTARAPRSPGDNPFVNGDLALTSGAALTDADERPIEAAPAPEVPAESPSEPLEGAEAPADGKERAVEVQESAVPEPVAQRQPEPSPPAQAQPQEEEHASVATPAGPEVEETGAVPKPSEEPVEGEYAKHEEVATPEAAKATRPGGAQARPPAVPKPSGGHAPAQAS